jgi:hypothetical protein
MDAMQKDREEREKEKEREAEREQRKKRDTSNVYRDVPLSGAICVSSINLDAVCHCRHNATENKERKGIQSNVYRDVLLSGAICVSIINLDTVSRVVLWFRRSITSQKCSKVLHFQLKKRKKEEKRK